MDREQPLPRLPGTTPSSRQVQALVPQWAPWCWEQDQLAEGLGSVLPVLEAQPRQGAIRATRRTPRYGDDYGPAESVEVPRERPRRPGRFGEVVLGLAGLRAAAVVLRERGGHTTSAPSRFRAVTLDRATLGGLADLPTRH